MIKDYSIRKFEEQGGMSTGVSAGMWAVVEIVERVVAFTDTEAQAREARTAFVQSAQYKPE